MYSAILYTHALRDWPEVKRRNDMTNVENAHIDWVKEVCAEHKTKPDLGLEFISNIEEIVKLCEKIGDDKIKGICENLRNPNSNRSTVTKKQRYSISVFLLSKYADMYEVVSAAWGISVEEAKECE